MLVVIDLPLVHGQQTKHTTYTNTVKVSLLPYICIQTHNGDMCGECASTGVDGPQRSVVCTPYVKRSLLAKDDERCWLGGSLINT